MSKHLYPDPPVSGMNKGAGKIDDPVKVIHVPQSDRCVVDPSSNVESRDIGDKHVIGPEPNNETMPGVTIPAVG